MDKNNIIKKDLLRRKIKEYFSKHPTSSSVIIKADGGEFKTAWRVVREGKNFNVTEVNTKREDFLIEAWGDDDIEAQIANLGQAFPDADDSDRAAAVDDPINPQVPLDASPKIPTTPDRATPNRMSKLPVGPSITPQQAMGPWDPNNQSGEFQKMMQGNNNNIRQTMMAMPDADLKRHFGIGKQSLSSPSADSQKVAQSGMKPYGQTSNKDTIKLNKNPNESVALKEASVEFSNMSRMFMDAMSNMGDHNKLSQALRDLNQKVGMVTDPTEKQQIGSMIGALTGAVDASTAGGGKMQVRSAQAPPSQPPGPLQTNSKKVAGRVVRETTQKKKFLKEEPLNQPNQDPNVAAMDAGLETSLDGGIEPELPAIKRPSSEEMMLGKNLAGQTIRSANIELKPDGGVLSLDLVNAAVPAQLEWNTSGQVVFSFNGRPYVLNRG